MPENFFHLQVISYKIFCPYLLTRAEARIYLPYEGCPAETIAQPLEVFSEPVGIEIWKYFQSTLKSLFYFLISI